MLLGAITTIFHQQGYPLAEQIRLIHEAGADFVDINENPDLLPKGELRDALRYVHRHHTPVRSVFALYDLSIIDPQMGAEVASSMKRRLDFGALFGAHNLLTGVGRVPACDRRDTAWQAAVGAMQKVADYAREVGMYIAVELEPYEEALVHDVESMQRFLADVGSPYCKANVDIAHCVLRRISAQEVKAIAADTVHVHLADCDGKVHVESVPGRGVVDFLPYLQVLQQHGFTGGAALEIQPSPNPASLVKEGLSYMRDLLGSDA